MGRLLKSALEFNNNWIDKKENVEVNQKLSIVIPVYYPKYLKEVLEHLSKLEGIYEVITVFDYVEKDLNQYIDDYNYNFIIVSHDKNYNASSARNTGSIYANGDLILFLDKDMILSPNYILKAKELLKVNNDQGVILGFRDNVDYKEVPDFNNWHDADIINDWRINTLVNDSFLDLTLLSCGSSDNNLNKNNILKIYEQSNKFRKLGINKKNTIGFWDLPCMVISHSLTIPREYFFEIGGYPEWTVGWGAEDIALGFLAVAKHLPIIPIEVGSYHIRHEPYSGSEKQKWLEMRRNLQKYKKWASNLDEYPSINTSKCIERSKVYYKSK